MYARAAPPAAEQKSGSREIHLLVLIHGMWGAPDQVSSLTRTIQDTYPRSDGPESVELEVLPAESNTGSYTYDGIVWGGERLVTEIKDHIESLEATGKSRVTRFSITGFSLGGLLARYVVAAFYHSKFFETVKPMNFNTFATPHLGLPKPTDTIPSIFATMASVSPTGKQVYMLDRGFGTKGEPLLLQMSHKDSAFYIGLSRFQNITIYANSVNDRAIPFPSAAIESEDPFHEHEVSGIEITLEDKFWPLIKSYRLPAEPTLSKPSATSMFSIAYIQKRRLSLPPLFQFPWPVQLVLLPLLPLVLPIFFVFAFILLSLGILVSYPRVRILEANQSKIQSLHALFGEGQEDVEHVIHPDDQPVSSSDSRSQGLGSSTPSLTPMQLQMANSLNSIPHLNKKFAYINSVGDSHATIVAPKGWIYTPPESGEGIVRHWAEYFVL